MIIAISCSCHPASADEAPAPVRMPEVVVTGTNLPAGAALQDSPQPVTVLDGREMERVGIGSVLELPRAVPNFSQSHAGLRSFSDNYVVRGLGNTDFLSDPAVVIYVDDVPFGNTLGYVTDLLAVDRLEFYRGPQGTRFGKNAEAGVIQIVTRQPTDRFAAEASASGATFGTQTYQAQARGPIVAGKLYFDLAGQYSKSDGYIKNTFLHTDAGESEGINGRGSLRWAPSDNWWITFTATGDKFDDGFGLTSLNSPNPRETQSELDNKFVQRVNSESLRVKGEASGISIASITARREYRLGPAQLDPDFSPLPGNLVAATQTTVQWSEELRVRPTAADGSWSWQSGFFFSTIADHVNRHTQFFIPPLDLSGTDTLDYTINSDNYAVFGDITRTLWEKLEVTAGLRLDYTVRKLDRTHTSTQAPPAPVHAEDDFFNAAPKLTLGYHATDALLVYGSTGLGFKPGGFSGFIDPPQSPEFETERAWASELGVKSSWLNNRVTANLALFYNDIWNYQVEQFVPFGLDFTVVNAPRARTIGAELELTARPVAGLELSCFGGYTDARLDSYTDPFTGATVHDAHPPYVAEFNAGVAAEYRHSSGFFGRIGYTGFGETFYDPTTPSLRQRPYGLLEARVGFERGHFGVFLFGENLSDTSYYMKKVESLNAGAPGRPQTFGIMVTAKY